MYARARLWRPRMDGWMMMCARAGVGLRRAKFSAGCERLFKLSRTGCVGEAAARQIELLPLAHRRDSRAHFRERAEPAVS